jgi:PAT family beta-lactamase induction signal transducer AmpG
MLLLGCVLLAAWLITLVSNGLAWTNWDTLPQRLVEAAALICLSGIALGSTLDFLALRREKMA